MQRSCLRSWRGRRGLILAERKPCPSAARLCYGPVVLRYERPWERMWLVVVVTSEPRQAELRFIGHRLPLSFKVTSWPKMYRSDSLEPDQIDDLYSELACVP